MCDPTDRKEGGVGDLNYPLVSDLKREISKKYNVLTDDGVALRGLFIIDKEVSLTTLYTCSKPGGAIEQTGVRRDGSDDSTDLLQGLIQHATINNLSFGRSVEETLRTLQAIQYVQENPDEVCPAGWQPGSVTMKPDPKKSKVSMKHVVGPGLQKCASCCMAWPRLTLCCTAMPPAEGRGLRVQCALKAKSNSRLLLIHGHSLSAKHPNLCR